VSALVLRTVALLVCLVATSRAQQQPAATETLDEVIVGAPQERERQRGMRTTIQNANAVTVELDRTISIHLRLVKEQTQVVFRRTSAGRKLPEVGGEPSGSKLPLRLELLPDRLIARQRPWITETDVRILANVDEGDGVPAYIPFGPNSALLNLDHVSVRDNQRQTRIGLKNAMHPQTRRCESTFWLGDVWPDGTNPIVLLGNSQRECDRAVKSRVGDLIFADSVPVGLKRAVQELYDPISSRMANLLGSEPGNLFIASWPESPHDGYRLQFSWNRNSLLLFNGPEWQKGIDGRHSEALRVSLLREQIQRRIRESDWPGAFTQSAQRYLLLLTRSQESDTTLQELSTELPIWISGCAGRMQPRDSAGGRQEDVSSIECGLLLQFVYDAVARSRSAGKQNIYSTWRKLLDASFRRGRSGTTPADFLKTSSEARHIAQGLVDGNMDWSNFPAAMAGFGVKLNASAKDLLPAFEVKALEHFDN
jgi:hypothetical protein